ncbi:MAG: ABC transporter permease [Gemmatimonadota bacterium]
MRDVWTVMWREWKELAVWDGGWVTLATLLAFAGLIGVFLPFQLGPAWLGAPWVLLFWVWMPLFLVTTVTADTVAGERERHTLETLLATRLPDRAILFGKIGAAVTWVWGATILCLPLGVLTVNLLRRPGELLLYEPGVAAGIAVVTFLAALLGAALGVLVSLRTPTVRQAQQALAMAVMLLFLVPLLALKLFPWGWANEILQLFVSGNTAGVAAGLAGLLGGMDLVLLGIAGARFRRERLLLD